MPARQFAVVILLFLSVMLTVCAVSCRVVGDESAPHKVVMKEAEDTVRSRFEYLVRSSPKNTGGIAKPDWQLAYTTWLPNEWPPRANTVWSRYAYGLDVALDGVSGVSEPIARLERTGGEAKQATLVPMANTLHVIASHAVRPHGGWHYTVEDEQRMVGQALALRTDPPADARTTIGIVSYYQSWQLGSAEIAAHVAPRHQAFFAWVKKHAK